MWSKLKKLIKNIVSVVLKLLKLMLNWHFALCFGLAWMITNGWAYVFMAIGPIFKISWMTIVGTSYVSFLWMPFTPEKFITIPLSLLFLKWLFPKDEKTKKDLENIKLKETKQK